MQILIDDIPEEGLEIRATEGDAWLLGLVREVAGASFSQDDHAALEVTITKIADNVNLDGQLEFISRPECDRCLVRFEQSSTVPLHTVLAPLYEDNEQKAIEEEIGIKPDMEDDDFCYYDGDRFDLSNIVREEALLARPMKNLCRDDCLGLCQRCGKNLNTGPCGCTEKRDDPRWNALKGVNIP